MKLLPLVLACVLAACADRVLPVEDGSSDVSDATLDVSAATDTAPADAPTDTPADVVVDASRPDSGPITCGMATCGASQFCQTRAGGAGIQMSCQEIPAACGAGPITCECLGATCPIDAHNRCTVSERSADCSCIDCP